MRLREFEKLDLTLDDEQRKALLDQFMWKDLQQTPEGEAMVERLLVKYHRISSKHTLFIGINNKFMIKLIREDDKSVLAQSLASPTEPKDEMAF